MSQQNKNEDLNKHKKDAELKTELKTETVITAAKPKKPIGVPVLPPTVPLTEIEKLKKKDLKLTMNDLKDESEKLDPRANNESNVIMTNEDKKENLDMATTNDKEELNVMPVEIKESVKEIIEQFKEQHESKEENLQEMHEEKKVVKEDIQTAKETLKTASSEIFSNNTKLSESTQEVKTETKQTTTKTETSTTTMTKKVIKSSTTSSQVVESKTCENILDNLEDLPEEFKKALEVSSKTLEQQKPISFSLQPYTERQGNTKITVLEERQFESDQKAYAEIRTKDGLTGEEKIQKSSETHKEKAKLKKVHSQDSLDDKVSTTGKLQPITVTAQAETRLSEEALNPQDNQSIVRGILNLSECGKQLQQNEQGGVDLVECEHQILETFEDSEQILSPNKEKLSLEKPSLVREISETLTVSKDGEKQVTKRSELTKEEPKSEQANEKNSKEDDLILGMEAQKLISDETQKLIDTVLQDAEKQVNKRVEVKEASKKGPKLVKKTEEEKKLEMEAQKLIDSYQKVKKEAEKLFQFERKAFNDDDLGFDLGELEKEDIKEDIQNEKKVETKEDIKVNEPDNLTEIALEINTSIEEVQEIPEVSNEAQPNIDIQIESIATTSPQPLIITPSSSEDFIDNEPVYVLHKNIIETPQETEKVEILEIIKIEEEQIPVKASPLKPTKIEEPSFLKEAPKIKESTNLMESIKIEEISSSSSESSKIKSVKLSPKLKKTEKKFKPESTKENQQKDELISPKTKSKPIPKPKPPVPQKRSDSSVKPIPKRRGSLETSHLTEQKLDTKNQESLKIPPTPINEIPKPMERIIVGVEHHFVIPTGLNSATSSPLTSPDSVITLASEHLPSVEKQSSLHFNMPQLSQTASGDLLETINLPNVALQTHKSHDDKEVLTSSSADSVKSAIEVEAVLVHTEDEEENNHQDNKVEIKIQEEKEQKIKGK